MLRSYPYPTSQSSILLSQMDGRAKIETEVNLKMAKKFCDCFPKTLQWLMLINTIIDQIMSSSKMQYFALKVKPSLNFKTVCSCKKSQDYLQCLQGLFTYIYEGSKVNFKIPTKAIRYCLLCIYNGGDQLKGDTTRKLGLYMN